MLTLRKVTADNVWPLLKLQVSPAQEDFVATNTESLIEAYCALSAGHWAVALGICANDLPVGFALLGYDRLDADDPPVAQGNYCLWRLMIDRRYQGHGYGRQAVKAVLDYLSAFPCGPAQACWLSYEPSNTAAKDLYFSLGFRENGQTCDGELVAVYPFKSSH